MYYNLPSKTFIFNYRDKEGLRELYTEEAFAVHEEAQEMLVSHLLALTTVDFSSFSIHYPAIDLTYRVAIRTTKWALRSKSVENCSNKER